MFRSICSARSIATTAIRCCKKGGPLMPKLFVSNVPWTVSSKELTLYFSQFGPVDEATVVFNPDTGLSRGYAFVTFSHDNVYRKVSQTTHHMLEGNLLNVHFEKPKTFQGQSHEEDLQ